MYEKVPEAVTATLITLLLSPAALALSWESSDGNWEVSLSGQVNVHNVFTDCPSASEANVINSSLVCTGDEDGDDGNFSIQNGLVPAAFVFGVSTTQKGWDLKAQLGLFPGIATNDPAGGGGPNISGGGALQNTGLGTTGLDVRQVFLTFGRAGSGTFKLGRDFGIFGADALLNDMTIFGVGPVQGDAATPANTTLGSIGVGYIYADLLAQANYTTPNFNGLEATIGLFEPLDPVNLAGTDLTGDPISFGRSGQNTEQPGIHGRLKYSYALSGFDGFASVSAISQDHPSVPGGGEQAFGVDITALVNYGGLSLLGYYYTAEGVGTTALFFDAFDNTGEPRDSDGALLQVSYTFGDTKLGLNYGISNLDATASDPGTLLEQHEKFTVGVYHSLTKNLMLLGEYSDFSAENQVGEENDSSNFNVGALLSF
mgnify:CR=1 FL=1